MKKRKVALVYDAIYPYVKGGGERRFYEMGKRLINPDTEVHLYGMKYWDGPNVIESDGLILHGLMKARPLYTKDGKRSISQALLFGLACFKIVGAKFDVIDCCGFPYFSLFPCKLASILNRKKLYSTWHEVWGLKYWRKYIGVLGFAGYFIERIASKLPYQFIVPSKEVARKLKEDLHVKQPVHVIANGIDLASLDVVVPAKKHSDIVYAGRLMGFKHVDAILQTVKKLKDDGMKVRCTIVGDGPESGSLHKLANDLGITKQITWHGFLEDINDVYAHLKASKVFMLPSSREGFGLIALEANACGLPVVTVNASGNAARFLVEDKKNGHVVNSEPKALAKVVKHWLKQSQNNCHEYARKFDWNGLAQSVAGVYAL